MNHFLEEIIRNKFKRIQIFENIQLEFSNEKYTYDSKNEILIMDEATSALDTETEKKIQENIQNPCPPPSSRSPDLFHPNSISSIFASFGPFLTIVPSNSRNLLQPFLNYRYFLLETYFSCNLMENVADEGAIIVNNNI